MDVTVVVATFGPEMWAERARTRAIPSAQGQAPTLHVHLNTLANARNAGAEQAQTEWLCFLDADDELEHGYIGAMAKGSADLRAPRVRFVSTRGAEKIRTMFPPNWEPDQMRDGNVLVIGTLVRRSMFMDVGGFREWPFYEDWDLWQRCWMAGATIEEIPAAVYRAHVRLRSRNRAPARRDKEKVHHMIRAANLPELYE